MTSDGDLLKKVEERFVTCDDINAMSARLLKAEMSNNKEKAAQLKTKLEKLREAQRRNVKVRLTTTVRGSPLAASSSHGIVHLTATDRMGREIPLHTHGYDAVPPITKTKHGRMKSHDENGNRIRYFEDASEHANINELVRQERLESGHSSNMQFISLAGKCKHRVDDEYDDVFAVNAGKSHNLACKRRKSDAIADYKRREYAESKCASCINHTPQYLVMSVGQRMFLSLPEHASMTCGHCLLSPLEHIGAMTRVDEIAVEEARAFKNDLCQMAASWWGRGSSYVFLEVASHPNSHKHHVQIECIPVDRDAMDELPSYFKKALLDLGSEWDQNTKIVSLRKPGIGARDAIPPNFSYFAVEFGNEGGGFAKVIEDWRSFPLSFGREVIAGVLGKTTDKWRKPKDDSLSDLRKKAVEFEEHWGALRHTIDAQKVAAPLTTEKEPEGPELPPSMMF
uniref:CwfJ_C_1 domain-containing protein n=1 Tax=Mesocestoides corti TaxID=53468 RepID=A0A5K3FB83_MESCO